VEGQRGGEVHRRGRLAHPALLVRHGEDAGHRRARQRAGLSGEHAHGGGGGVSDRVVIVVDGVRALGLLRCFTGNIGRERIVRGQVLGHRRPLRGCAPETTRMTHVG
jgi:hypothetical protein